MRCVRLAGLSLHAWGMLLPAGCLCAFGLLTLQAIGRESAETRLAPEALKQMQFVALGLAATAGTALIGYQRLGRWAARMYAVILVLLIYLVADKYVDLPLVAPRHGARGWLLLPGFQLQPAELMKPVYVLTVAWYLRYRRNYRTLKGLLPPFLLTLIPMALIVIQPDLGTVLMFLPVLFALLFVAGARISHLLVIILLGVACLPLFWLKIHAYQRLRVAGVFLQSQAVRDYFQKDLTRWDRLRPRDESPRHWRRELIAWEQQTGYQLVHSKAAIGSGGLRGQGWGQGPFLNRVLLPENNNDFIFAVIAHQWGLVGALLVIGCYVVLILTAFAAASTSSDPFARLLGLGVATMFAVQTLTHLCVNVGLGPVTGVTLPFVSAGGTSMVVSFATLGILISISHDRPILIGRKPFSFDPERGEFIDVPQLANR